MASNRQAQAAQDALVPLTNAQYFKLLEPIILFRALNDAVRQSSDDDVKYGATQSSPTVTTTGVEDRDDLFRAFVYKLAHICDSSKGGLGATITSFTILRSENPETRDTMVHYWFASNRRTTSQLDETKAYVHAILRKVQLAPRDTNAYKCNILRDIILFNRMRLSWYLSELSCSVRQCHSVIDKVFSTADASLGGGPSQKDLAKILVAIDIPDFPVAEDDDATSAFVYGYERLMRRLTELENSDAGRDIAKHVRELPRLDRPSDECWHQFQHAMTRILAYPKSLQCILNARGEWPSLFAEYQIFYVQSSTAPIEKQWRSKSLTADGIVGRMARRQSEITRFREFTQQLQNCNLDTRIEAEFKRKTFKPIVHCEMLLLNFLEHSGGGITADRFFEAKRERMYIGSSKPLCKLCKFYFEEHGSGVGHRPTHNNLYTNWRLPDVAKSQGWAAKDGREKMLERMLKRVRADTLSLVMDKLPASGKYNDSNTFSANVSLYNDDSTIAADDVDDITTMLGEVEVHDDEYHEDGVFITTVPDRRVHKTGVSRAVPRGAGNYPSVAQSLLLSQSSITSRSS